jgi:hypothetical protein
MTTVTAELEQLAAEVEQVRRELSRVSDYCRSLRRMVGVFYDAGVDDALAGQERGERHLRLVRGG